MLPKRQDYSNFDDNVENMKYFIEHYEPEMDLGGPIIYGPENELFISELNPQYVWTEIQKNTTIITNGFITSKDDPEINGYYVCKKPCTELPFSQGIHTEIYIICESCETKEAFEKSCKVCKGQGFFYRYLNEIWENL